MKNPHEGLHSDRLYPNRDNPREVAFAEQWKEENKEIGIGFIMRYLVPNYSQRDAEVAATVIQWLGSQCGQSFLEEVEKKIRKAKDKADSVGGKYLKFPATSKIRSVFELDKMKSPT